VQIFDRLFFAPWMKSRIGNINGLGRSLQAVPTVGNHFASAIDEFLIEGPTVFPFLCLD
jgi:hypothetical protein